jgi:hypothetical protein
MKILLNVLGVMLFFINRFAGRKDQTAPISVKFWLKDNWEQLICVTIVDVVLMLLVITGGLEFNFEKIAPMLPDGVKLIGDLALCFLVGAVFAWVTYVGYKKIIQGK